MVFFSYIISTFYLPSFKSVEALISEMFILANNTIKLESNETIKIRIPQFYNKKFFSATAELSFQSDST